MSETLRVPVFIAGPFAAPTLAEIEVNVKRAAALGYFASSVHGLSPLVPHCMGFLSVHGATTDGDKSAARNIGLASGRSQAAMVARSGGHLWVICREDGSLSDGTQGELDAFREQGITWTQNVKIRPWSAWSRILLAELSVGPLSEPHLAVCR